MTGLYLDADHCQAIAQAAAHSYPQECCGLLIGRLELGAIAAAEFLQDYRQVVEVIALTNAWEPALLDYTDSPSTPKTSHSDRDRYWPGPSIPTSLFRSATARSLTSKAGGSTTTINFSPSL
jgi:proteasome lid subunit RPN8/RPN11